MIRRREFIALLGGTAAAWPLAARAQQPDQIQRIGFLGTERDNPLTARGYPAFVAELNRLGFTEGHNLTIEHRRTDEGTARVFANANELAASKVNVLVASGSELALQAAAAVRPAVPIVVMAINFDPIARGYVASLSRPGGNITGVFYRQPELAV